MWRWERREKKTQAKKNRMPKHGQSLSEVYKNAILRRVK